MSLSDPTSLREGVKDASGPVADIFEGSMRRREALQIIAAASCGAAAACSPSPKGQLSKGELKAEPVHPIPAPSPRMPVIFAAHGAPILLDDAAWMSELAAWAQAMPKPQSILMVSAHWEARPLTLGATKSVPLLYDFYGFPSRYYRTQYPAPGAPELAGRVRQVLRGKSIPFADDATRGLDHGAYVPLLAMYPRADIPVLQISMPGLDPAALFGLGQLLAPLRDEGVLVFGSGFLTHNMAYVGRPGTPPWALEFDDWVAGALWRFDPDALKEFKARAPAAQLALPTWEHYAPVLVAAGAAASDHSRTRFPITGWWMGGAFSKRSVQFG